MAMFGWMCIALNCEKSRYSPCIIMMMTTQHRVTQKQRKSYTNERKVSQTREADTHKNQMNCIADFSTGTVLVWHDNVWYDACSLLNDTKNIANNNNSNTRNLVFRFSQFEKTAVMAFSQKKTFNSIPIFRIMKSAFNESIERKSPCT